MSPISLRLRLAATLLVAAASPLAAQQATPPALAPRTRWEAQARAMLKELVEINTTHSVGNTVTAAEAMAKHMRAAGFPSEDVIVVENAPRKGNLIVRYRGRSTGRKPILLLSHIDVVEADPKDWTLPPFEFIERDGIFYGRGVADDKDESAMHLTILLRMKAEGVVPDRDIIVALTAVTSVTNFLSNSFNQRVTVAWLFWGMVGVVYSMRRELPDEVKPTNTPPPRFRVVDGARVNV